MEVNEKQNLAVPNVRSQKGKQDWTERLKLANKQLTQAFLMMQKPVPAYEVLTAIANDLLVQGFSDEQIESAITRVTRECEWVTPKAIIERIPGGGKDDGRPEVEVAWAMCPKTEEASVVWTDEMLEAYGVARSLIFDGDMIGARMAFKEAYGRELLRARADGRPIRWTVSLGWDKCDRVRALADGIAKHRLSAVNALGLLGLEEQDQLLLQLPVPEQKQLRGEKNANPALSGFHQTLQIMRENMGIPAEPKADRRETTPEEWAEKKRVAKAQLAQLEKTRDK